MGVAVARPHSNCGRGCTYSPLVKISRNHHCEWSTLLFKDFIHETWIEILLSFKNFSSKQPLNFCGEWTLCLPSAIIPRNLNSYPCMRFSKVQLVYKLRSVDTINVKVCKIYFWGLPTVLCR